MALLQRLLSLLLVGLWAVLLLPPSATAGEIAKRGTLTQVTSFGSNPSGTLMYIYVPTTLATKPPIIVAIHQCTGSASEYYESTPYASLADQHGFIVIFPQSPYSGTCWDVSSTAALTHNGGADSNSIANMVTYTLSQYNGDATRVFVTGSSSGAMMTNVMAATYPELFAAASVYSGVSAGCFYTGTVDGWNATCAEGDIIESQQYWTNVALAMYPGYTGSRPRMLIFHGTADTTLYPQNFYETLKQWTGVFGYTYTPPEETLDNTPSSVYTEYIYGPDVVGILGAGVGHTVPVNGTEDMAWFGIAGTFFSPGTSPTGGTTGVQQTTTSTTSTGQTTSKTTTTTPPTTITTPPTGGTQSEWGQCGGSYYTGPTVCASPYTCSVLNPYYYQCL